MFSFNDDPLVAAPVHTLVNAANTTTINLSTGVQTLGATVTYVGLPVIGFAAESFNNTALTINGVTYLSTFGAEYAHRLQTKVQ